MSEHESKRIFRISKLQKYLIQIKFKQKNLKKNAK